MTAALQFVISSCVAQNIEQVLIIFLRLKKDYISFGILEHSGYVGTYWNLDYERPFCVVGKLKFEK